MSNYFIKYCGFRRLTDVLYATSLGVDALGFVFYDKSSRYISPAHAASIIKNLKKIRSKINQPYTVGLFVNHTISEVLDIAQTTGIDILQFHGDESPEFCENLSQILNLPYIKVISMMDDFFEEADYQILQQQYPNACAFLLDKKSEQHGGSGEKFNWQNIEPSLWLKNPKFQGIRRSLTKDGATLILAGGIFIEDIQVLKNLNINAIDLSTGLEVNKKASSKTSIYKGIKSQQLMYDLSHGFKN